MDMEVCHTCDVAVLTTVNGRVVPTATTEDVSEIIAFVFRCKLKKVLVLQANFTGNNMKKFALSVAILTLAFSSVHAQQTVHGQPDTSYTEIGDTTIGSDGTPYTIIGDTTFGSDGSSRTRIGDTTFDSDGSSATQIGDTLFDSDGSTVAKIGDTTFGSDGTTCTKIGDTKLVRITGDWFVFLGKYRDRTHDNCEDS